MVFKIEVCQEGQDIFAKVVKEDVELFKGNGDNPYSAVKDACNKLGGLMSTVETLVNHEILETVSNDDGERFTLKEAKSKFNQQERIWLKDVEKFINACGEIE